MAIFIDLVNSITNSRRLIGQLTSLIHEHWSSSDQDLTKVILKSKYYQAEVDFQAVKYDRLSELIVQNRMEQPCECLVIFNETIDIDLTRANGIVQLLKPNNLLLVIDLPSDDYIKNASTTQWCIDNEAEQIILNPTDEDIEDAKECNEKWGIQRLLQALEQHQWPNSELFDNAPQPKESTSATNGTEIHVANGTSTTIHVDDRASSTTATPSTDPLQSFEQLMSQLPDIQRRCQRMNREDRLDYAAMIAEQFMSACGDDVSDLEESDNEFGEFRGADSEPHK